jgi:hypothetical protein
VSKYDLRYDPASHLEVPGLEAILEYGDASAVKRDRIPGAMLINDHSLLDRVRITQMDGLHDDPEGSDTRQPNADRHGERAGNMFYRGRTIGLTGRAEAGNISAMRSIWRRLRSQFGTVERDLLIHHPFEVGTRVNEVVNPSFEAEDAEAPIFGWLATSSAGGVVSDMATFTQGVVRIGGVSLTGATGAGVLRVYEPLLHPTSDMPMVSEWEGEDVWITVCLKVDAATATVSSLAVGLAQWTNTSPGVASVVMSSNQASVASPVTDTWHTLTVRVPATTIAPTTTHVTPYLALNFAGAGNFDMAFHRCAAVLVRPEDPTPPAYFDGDLPGFDYQGVSKRSRSIGPTHAENQIPDPQFNDLIEGARTLTGWSTIGSDATYNTLPSRSTRWSGSHVDASLYVKATKNATSSAAFGIQANNVNGLNYFPVVEQRIYRLSAKINTLVKPNSGDLNLSLSWLQESGVVISTITSEFIELGEDEYSVTAVAPERTAAAQVLVQTSGTTSSGQVLEFFLSDPCLVDITDWDPGDFYGVGDPSEEAGNYRRIPNPFLVKGVRKTSDMKAPEQQSRNRAWRDFTMSLRASDPRIYSLYERRISARLPFVDVLKFVVASGSAFTQSTPAPVPSGFTYEGHNIPATVGWSSSWITISPDP